MSPDAENVIDVAFPKQRSVISRREGLLFPVMHENVSKGGCVFFFLRERDYSSIV